MPYIPQKDRIALDPLINQLSNLIVSEGELNYVLTRLVKGYIDREGACYATYNKAIGVLECAKLELYRRPVAAYEGQKLNQNGDVY